MRLKLVCFCLLCLFRACFARGQGSVFVYDQQSSTNEHEFTEQDRFIDPRRFGPVGQSFTPALPSVGFIQLGMYFNALGNTGPGIVDLNLRTGSITGPILASTEPLDLPSGFAGYPKFFFAQPVAVDPGVTYYLDVVIQSGNDWGCL